MGDSFKGPRTKMSCHVGVRDILIACRTRLVEEMSDIQRVMDFLHQEGVCSKNDIEVVKGETTTDDKNRALLDILGRKPEKKLGETFKKALQQSQMGWLIGDLEERECYLQARELVRKIFTESDDSEISWDDIVKCIKDGTDPPELFERLDADDQTALVEEVISKVFDNATVRTQKGRLFVQNVRKLEAKPVEGTRGSQQVKQKVEEWDVSAVTNWLRARGVPHDVIQDFQDQEVSGNILQDITEEDLKGAEFPHVNTFGRRKDLLHKIRDLLSQKEVYLEEKETELDPSKESLPLGSQNVAINPTTGIKQVEIDKNAYKSKQEKEATPVFAKQPGKQSELDVPHQLDDDHSYSKENNVDDCRENTGSDTAISENVDKAQEGSSGNGNTCQTDRLESLEAHEVLCFSSPTEFENGEIHLPEKYKHMERLDSNKTVSDLINPVKLFENINLGDDQNLLPFTETIMTLASAALNARTNARIFVGIDTDGTIHGTALNRPLSVYQKLLKTMINKCFHKGLSDAAQECVRHPKFVLVENSSVCQEELYVVEIDVIAAADICKDCVFGVKLPDLGKSNIDEVHMEKEEKVFKMENGPIQLISGEEKINFGDKIKDLNDLRKFRENAYRQRVEKMREDMPHLTNKLLDLLGLNSGKYVDLYPIIVTTKPDPDMDKVYFQNSLAFFANTRMKAVFDFDAEGTIQSFLQNDLHQMFKVIPTTDEFDECSAINRDEPEKISSLQEGILDSKTPHWIFCNGFNAQRDKFPELSQIQWNKTKKEGLKESVNFFKRQIPQGRAVIIFMILSNEPKMMTDAIQEFMSAFPDQWMFLAEKADLVQGHIDELTRRSQEEYDVLMSRTITDLPLKKVQETIIKATGFIQGHSSTLPCSDGKDVVLNDILKSQLSDLEILSSTECEHLGGMPQETQKQLKVEKELSFYKGGEVSWENFFFQNHVLKRSKHRQIYQAIQETAKRKKNEDSHLGRITLYHQPGAGGTTMAKHLLWNFRKIFRCAIVRSKTEHTASQISDLRLYGDRTPKPVLLLLDNLDEEPATHLLSELELQAKQSFRSMENTDKLIPYCIVLVCLRRSKMPLYGTSSYKTQLKQELTADELKWFQKKSDELEERYGANDSMKTMINPKLLISFNIMKTSFDKDFIRRITEETVRGIENKLEKRLLKYVALLNAFDLSFREIPCAAFDNMMVTIPWQPGARRGRGAAARCWEANLSEEFKVLINETSSSSFTSIKAMRITHPLLSKEILRLLKYDSGKKETTSTMMLEFLNSKDIFSVTSHAKENLLKIVKDVMKRRNRLPAGHLESQFAPLIQEIVNIEKEEPAMDVLVKAFQLTQDPFVAQQVARLCIYKQDWETAENYIQQAIDKKPDNSFLLDTSGRIYHTRLAEKSKQFIKVPEKRLDMTEVLEVVEIAMTGADKFRQEQICSEKELHGFSMNNAGYFGELEILQCLLHCLHTSECFDSIEELRKFLLETNYYPPSLQDTTEENRVCLSKLKGIKSSMEETLHKLEDERMQLRDETFDEYRDNSIKQRNKKMEEIQTDLDFYLGEQSEKIPSSVDPNSEEACKLRRRIIRTFGGKSTRMIFDLKLEIEGEDKLNIIRRCCEENINTEYNTAMDYQVNIAACISLAAVNIQGVRFTNVRSLTQDLYRMRHTENRMIFLEPYLFYVLFNWPRQGLNMDISDTPKNIQLVLEKWKEAYYRKWPNQRDGSKPQKQKEKTIFFFGVGSDMMSIVGYHQIKGMQRGEIFWKEPFVLRTLRRFEGVLLSDGEHVSVDVKHPSGERIEIPTSFPIRDRTMLNKTVYFVIGLSWKGPRAFDLSLLNPTEDVRFMVSDDKAKHRSENPPELRNEKPPITQTYLIRKLNEVKKKLERIEKLKARKGSLNKYEENLLAGQERLMREREDLMWHRMKLVNRITLY